MGLQVSGKLALPRWVFRVFQTGLYLPTHGASLHVPDAQFLLHFILFLSSFLSFCCFSLTLIIVTWCASSGGALQAVAMRMAASIAALRTVVLLSGKQSQTVFPGIALCGSYAAQLILH